MAPTEAFIENVGFHNSLELAARIMPDAIVDGESGGSVGESPTQTIRGPGRITVGDGEIGAFKECGGFTLVEPDSSHWLRAFSL